MAATDTSVVVQMTAQDAELVAAWQRARKGPRDFADEVERAGKKGKHAGEEMSEAFVHGAKHIISHVGGITTVMGGVMTLVESLKKHWEALIEKQKEALGQAVGIEGVRRRVVNAIQPGADIGAADALERIGPNPTKLSMAAAALKRGGEKFSATRSIETMEAAFKLTPTLPDVERESITSGAVILQQNNPSLTPKQAVAQIIAMSRRSESSGAAVSENIIRSIARMQHLTSSPATDIEALSAAIEGVTNRGAESAGQATEKIVGSLAIEGETMRAVKRGATVDEMIAAARKNPKLREKVLGKLRKDKGAYAAARELFEGPETATSTAFAAARAEYGGATPAEILTREESRQAEFAKLPGISEATGGRLGKEIVEEDLARDPILRFRAYVFEKRAEARKLTTGRKWWNPAEDLQEYGARFAAPFESPERTAERARGEMLGIMSEGVSDPKTLAAIKELAELIAKQLEITKQQLDEMKKTKPQAVTIAGDKRADVQQQSAAGNFSD